MSAERLPVEVEEELVVEVTVLVPAALPQMTVLTAGLPGVLPSRAATWGLAAAAAIQTQVLAVGRGVGAAPQREVLPPTSG